MASSFAKNSMDERWSDVIAVETVAGGSATHSEQNFTVAGAALRERLSVEVSPSSVTSTCAESCV